MELYKIYKEITSTKEDKKAFYIELIGTMTFLTSLYIFIFIYLPTALS